MINKVEGFPEVYKKTSDGASFVQFCQPFMLNRDKRMRSWPDGARTELAVV